MGLCLYICSNLAWQKVWQQKCLSLNVWIIMAWGTFSTLIFHFQTGWRNNDKDRGRETERYRERHSERDRHKDRERDGETENKGDCLEEGLCCRTAVWAEMETI